MLSPTPRPRPAPIFAALGDRTRLGLVERLARGEALSLSALTRGSDLSRQAVSKHLRVLAEAGIVHQTPHGRETLWRIEAAPLREATDWLEQIRAQWDERLDRLEAYLNTLQNPAPADTEKDRDP